LLAGRLMVGQSTVLEYVAPLAVRAEWRTMSVRADQRLMSIEFLRSDRDQHQARVHVGGRVLHVPGPRWSARSDALPVIAASLPLP
jgi:hypothetical protein